MSTQPGPPIIVVQGAPNVQPPPGASQDHMQVATLLVKMDNGSYDNATVWRERGHGMMTQYLIVGSGWECRGAGLPGKATMSVTSPGSGGTGLTPARETHEPLLHIVDGRISNALPSMRAQLAPAMAPQAPAYRPVPHAQAPSPGPDRSQFNAAVLAALAGSMSMNPNEAREILEKMTEMNRVESERRRTAMAEERKAFVGLDPIEKPCSKAELDKSTKAAEDAIGDLPD